jgi:hypothetical protein
LINDLILIYPPSTKDQVTNSDDIDEVLGPLSVKPKVDDFNDDILRGAIIKSSSREEFQWHMSEEEKNKIVVEENINTIKIELLNNETNIVKVSHEIKELIKNKTTFQSITLEINKLELEIKNYKNSIINYEKDLLSLN